MTTPTPTEALALALHLIDAHRHHLARCAGPDAAEALAQLDATRPVLVQLADQVDLVASQAAEIDARAQAAAYRLEARERINQEIRRLTTTTRMPASPGRSGRPLATAV